MEVCSSELSSGLEGSDCWFSLKFEWGRAIWEKKEEEEEEETQLRRQEETQLRGEEESLENLRGKETNRMGVESRTFFFFFLG